MLPNKNRYLTLVLAFMNTEAILLHKFPVIAQECEIAMS